MASYNARPGRSHICADWPLSVAWTPISGSIMLRFIASEKIGRETVRYVSNNGKCHLAYWMIEEPRAERGKANESVKSG